MVEKVQMKNIEKLCLDAKRREPDTELSITSEVMDFIGYIGSKPAGAYTISDIKLYLEALQTLPVNAKKLKATRDLKTMQEMIDKGQKLGLKTLSPRTVNNRYTNLTIVFSFAEKMHLIGKSPCVDTLRVEDQKKENAEHIDSKKLEFELILGRSPSVSLMVSDTGKQRIGSRGFHWSKVTGFECG
jgi:hypothetical protein